MNVRRTIVSRPFRHLASTRLSTSKALRRNLAKRDKVITPFVKPHWVQDLMAGGAFLFGLGVMASPWLFLSFPSNIFAGLGAIALVLWRGYAFADKREMNRMFIGEISRDIEDMLVKIKKKPNREDFTFFMNHADEILASIPGIHVVLESRLPAFYTEIIANRLAYELHILHALHEGHFQTVTLVEIQNYVRKPITFWGAIYAIVSHPPKTLLKNLQYGAYSGASEVI